MFNPWQAIGLWLAIVAVIFAGACIAGARHKQCLADNLVLASIFWTFCGLPLMFYAWLLVKVLAVA